MSLYLSQIDIDYAVAIKRHIRDAYNWHKKAWLAFPGRECEERDFLTRLDRRESDDQFRLLILSETKPTRPDWCPTDSWRTREVGASFLEHSCFQFSLLANPTKKVRVEAENGNRRKNGRRVALVTREERLAWLERKASESGFRIDPDKVRTVPRGREYFHKPGHRGTRPLSISVAPSKSPTMTSFAMPSAVASAPQKPSVSACLLLLQFLSLTPN